MKVTEVKYLKRFNIGNYEHQEFSITAIPQEKKKPEDCFSELVTAIEQVFTGQVGAEAVNADVKNLPKSKDDKKSKTQTSGKVKKSKQSPEPEDVEEEEEEEIVEEEAADETDVEGEDEDSIPAADDEEVVEEEEEEEDDRASTPANKSSKTKAAAPAKAAKGKKAPKETPYDRTKELHKDLCGQMLDEAMPKWRKTHLAQAKTTSTKMNGKAFLDADGDVLESFKSEYLKTLKKVK